MAIEIIQRKKGKIYRATFYKDGQRYRCCFDRKYDAEKWLQDQQSLNRYGYQPKITFSEAVDRWIENHSKIHKAPSSHRGDLQMVNLFKDFFGSIEMDKITTEMIEKLTIQMIRKNIKHATVNRHLQCLKAILNYFIKKRYLLFNVVSIVGLLPETEVAYDYLSFEEADSFLSHARQKYAEKNRSVYILYLIAINTGLRWGEIAALKWDRIDLVRGQITVCRSYCRSSKTIRETTKGRKVRHVGINSALLPELQWLKNHSNHPSLLVFENREGNVLDIDDFKRDFYEKDLKEAELRHIRFHDLRHTFASHFMTKGGNLYDLQKLMGHSDISTTERYAHLSIESLTGKTELVAIRGDEKEVVQLDEYREKNRKQA